MLFDKKDTYSLRGLCMIGIILHHIYQYVCRDYGLSFPAPIGIILGNLGYLATAVFFTISGFGLYLSINRHRPLSTQYIVAHMLKLWLPFFFIWIVDVSLCVFTGSANLNNFILSFATLSLPSGQSLWFMKSIFVIYAAVFLLCRLFQPGRALVNISFILIGVYILIDIFALHLPTFWYNSILCFPIGMLMAEYRDKVEAYNNPKTGLLFIVAFIVVFCLQIVLRSHLFPRLVRYFAIIILPIVSGVLFSISSLWSVQNVHIRNKIFDFIGTNSISFYLFHVWVLISPHENMGVYKYICCIVFITTALALFYKYMIGDRINKVLRY